MGIRKEFDDDFNEFDEQYNDIYDKSDYALWAAKWALKKAFQEAEMLQDSFFADRIRQLSKELTGEK